MSYEKLWENLNHKRISNPFGVSKLPYSVDLTTRGTEFPRTYYSGTFQDQIDSLNRAETDVRLWEPESPRPVGGTVQIKEDIRASYLPYSYINLSSDMNVVLAHREIGTHYWQDLQRLIVNLSQTEPKSPQLVDETAQVEDIRGSYSLCTPITPLSDVNVDVVLVQSETGTAITDFTQLRKSQAEKQKLEISEQFNILAQREDNWDGRDSQKPTDLTLAHAKEVMGTLLDSVISAGYWYDTPSISSDGDGNVTAVWYKDERQLHLQIGEHEAEYFKVWGTNIDTEMDVDFLTPENYLPLWKWLIDERQLHLQIGEHEAEYFKVWGTNIDTEMDVDFLTPENYLPLWKWLIDE